MKTRSNRWLPVLLCGVVPFLLACMYLQSMIQVPEPKMETDTDKVISALNGDNWVDIHDLVKETYTEEDFAKPGTLTFTATVTNDKPVYLSYGWCTTSQDILQQNLDHIKVDIYFNDGKLGSDVVHNLAYSLTDGKFCSDFGVLMSDWPAGNYKMKVVATFDQKINDGESDYDAGDYIFLYDITAK